MAQRLPIYEIERALSSALKGENRLIISAPTGSGKSTQVPQMLLACGLVGDGQVVILQPRRLAARLLAARVAKERGVELGEEVGYQIRFENRVQQPTLPGVSALIFDEFHERHLYGDVSLGQAIELQAKRRPDLKVLVMSATLDSPRLHRAMQGPVPLRPA